MSSDLIHSARGSVTRRYGPIRRLGSGIGVATIGVLDLLALEDITTAGAWMPEIGFLIASLPALIVLIYFLVARSTGDEESP